MAFLTKQQILAANDKKYAEVSVPEWGGTVRIASMSAAQRDKYEMLYLKARSGGSDGSSLRSFLVAMCIVDEAGVPVFSAADVSALGDKSGNALDRVFAACTRLNVMTDDGVEEKRGN